MHNSVANNDNDLKLYRGVATVSAETCSENSSHPLFYLREFLDPPLVVHLSLLNVYMKSMFSSSKQDRYNLQQSTD